MKQIPYPITISQSGQHPMAQFVQRRNAIVLEQARNHNAPVLAVVGAGNANASLNLPEDVGVPFVKGYFYARRVRADGLDAPIRFYAETDSKGVPYTNLVAGQKVFLYWDNDSNPGGWKLKAKRPTLAATTPLRFCYSFTNWHAVRIQTGSGANAAYGSSVQDDDLLLTPTGTLELTTPLTDDQMGYTAGNPTPCAPIVVEIAIFNIPKNIMFKTLTYSYDVKNRIPGYYYTFDSRVNSSSIINTNIATYFVLPFNRNPSNTYLQSYLDSWHTFTGTININSYTITTDTYKVRLSMSYNYNYYYLDNLIFCLNY